MRIEALNLDLFSQKFRAERVKEEQKLEEEVKEEWEKRLQLIQAQYEADLKRKRDQKDQKVRNVPLRLAILDLGDQEGSNCDQFVAQMRRT